jgi:hypothetical protein
MDSERKQIKLEAQSGLQYPSGRNSRKGEVNNNNNNSNNINGGKARREV